MKRIAVMTSGGDAPGMNAAIRAVVRTGIHHGFEVYGIRQAYAGLLRGDIAPLTHREVSGILQRGGTILQTARDEEFKTPKGKQKALRRLNEQQIEAVVVIGGDGSLRGAMALHELGVPVIGIPASIDNDIFGTDMSIGVDSALNTILDALDRLRDTATSHNRAFIIEVMGRNCGYLALTSGILGGAEIVVTPERDVSKEEVAQLIQEAYIIGKAHAIIVVAEGAAYSCNELTEFLNQQEIPFEIRVSILGHIQRGGSPSAFDRLLATSFGVAAVKYLVDGQKGVMVARVGRENVPLPLGDVVSQPRQISNDYFEFAEMLV